MWKKLIGVGISENKEHSPHSAQGQCEGSSQRLHLPLLVQVAAQNPQTTLRTGTTHGHEQKTLFCSFLLLLHTKQKCRSVQLLTYCPTVLQFSPRNSCLSACVSLQSELGPGECRAHTKQFSSASLVQHSDFHRKHPLVCYHICSQGCG